jgi:hypothetical protein
MPDEALFVGPLRKRGENMKRLFENIEVYEELDIYTEQGIIDSCEDDEISSGEEGFMIGYLAA